MTTPSPAGEAPPRTSSGRYMVSPSSGSPAATPIPTRPNPFEPPVADLALSAPSPGIPLDDAQLFGPSDEAAQEVQFGTRRKPPAAPERPSAPADAGFAVAIPREYWSPEQAPEDPVHASTPAVLEEDDEPDQRTSPSVAPPVFEDLPTIDAAASADVVGQAAWSGKLEEIAAAEALDRLSRFGASGSLEFKCGLIWKRVQLDQGMPVAITSNMGMELIGEHLVKARLLSRRELDRALHAAERDGQPLTTKLLDLNMIEKARLEDELGKNLSARLSEVLEWRWGTFEFVPQPPESGVIRPKLDLGEIIRAAVEARAKAEVEEPRPPEARQGSEQSRIKEAFKRARSIAQSAGKGRVDDVNTPGSRPPPPKR